jgi:pilus assembly protein Flp/PilA
MSSANRLMCRFARDRRGATAIEYGLIALLIAVGMLAALRSLGDGNSGSWNSTAGKVNSAMSGK